MTVPVWFRHYNPKLRRIRLLRSFAGNGGFMWEHSGVPSDAK